MSKFNIGDIVEVNGEYDCAVFCNQKGVVIENDRYREVGVEFYENIKDDENCICGHDLGGRIKSKKGWWIIEDMAILYSRKKINKLIQFLR